jgi:hypothetical protein
VGKRNLLIVVGVLALVVPNAAIGKSGHGHGHGHGGKDKAAKNKPKMYVFKGTYNVDGSVHVIQGNGRVRKAQLVGTDVQFDYANARVIVADTNGDSVSDINDVVSPDAVLVQAKLGKTDPGPQPYAARKLIDRTNPPVDEQD